MKYALIHISPPQTQDRNADGAYRELLERIQKAAQSHKSNEQLAENVWLIPLEGSQPILATMCLGGQAQHLRIRVLFLEDPQWISLNA
jgi:hypothetical protein